MWARYERFVLDGPDSDYVVLWFWPHFLALLAFIPLSLVHDCLYQ